MNNANNSNITPVEVALMQHLFNHLQSTSGTKAFPSKPSPSFPPPSQPSLPSPSQLPSVFTPSQPVPSTISNQQPIQATQSPTVHPITEPYLSSGISQAPPASEDVHHATSTHFIQSASSAARAILSSQHFLGFNELSIDMTGQAN